LLAYFEPNSSVPSCNHSDPGNKEENGINITNFLSKITYDTREENFFFEGNREENIMTEITLIGRYHKTLVCSYELGIAYISTTAALLPKRFDAHSSDWLPVLPSIYATES
jgi:hypothetical protein